MGATGTGVIFSTGGATSGVLVLDETAAEIALADAFAARTNGLTTVALTAGLPGFATTTLATGLTGALAVGLEASLAAGLIMGFAVLATATLLTVLTGALAADLGAGLDATLAVALLATVVLATGLADLATGLVTAATDWAANLPLGWLLAAALVGATLAWLLFPGLAFTACLLAERICSWSVVLTVPLRILEDGAGGASTARECTGFPTGNPISCKIETII
ncbi:hypothetical protein [Candidatus Aalborgicola defluviihabitans]|uniref:hypothetical protein n=1 Tax=Candidatus Aalborgicola defluviihabitans TaxID=3386187 RepID=UPI0039B91AF9